MFVQHVEPPLETRAAQRAICGTVIARYTSFGSGSPAWARSTEQMDSLRATLHTAGRNP